jgi:hypothetical protein
MTAFDTLAFAERMEGAGMDRDLSRALAHAMQDVAMQNVATKADLEKAVHTLTVRGFAALASLAGLLLAAIALF